jgi:hypothetical protein
MPQVRIALVLTVLVLSAYLATRARTQATSTGGTSINSGDQVLNAPYSAQRHFTSTSKGVDGTTSRTESSGSEARDSQGRTYSAGERHWTYLDDGKSVLKSEILYRIDDPVARTETRWDSTSKKVKVIHFPKSASEGNALRTRCPSACPETGIDDSSLEIEKLGHKVIEGVEADGERKSYTVPVGQDHNDHPIVVTHETWYCPELKIIVLETNDDPRSGQTTNQLLNIVRGEPNTDNYRPPANYVVNDVQLPY